MALGSHYPHLRTRLGFSGKNLIEENKAVFNEKKKPILERINQKIRFIK